MVPSQVDTRSNLVISNPSKASKIFLGESSANLNFVHIFFNKAKAMFEKTCYETTKQG